MRSQILQIVKATLAAIIFSLACVLIFSLIIQLFSLSASAVKPVNQVIKTLAIAAGGILFIRGDRGLFKGAVSGSFAVSWMFVLEIALGAVAGAISGVIGVNLKGRG